MSGKNNAGDLVCHHCGAGALRIAVGYDQAWRVTSDCKPWPPGGQFALCQKCGLVQTVVNSAWEGDCARIYEAYTIYYQSGGAEQPVFDNASGASQSRSQAILRAVKGHVNLPAKGRWLDIGCGNGALLRACSAALPDWQLYGSEVNDKYRSVVENIPGVEKLLVGPVSGIDLGFDVVSLVHVLEHIPHPAQFLKSLHRLLNPGGLILIEVPDCQKNHFIIMVADHCSHFSVGMLSNVVSSAGYRIENATTTWVPKEITVVARKETSPEQPALARPPLLEAEEVFGGWDELRRICNRVSSLPQGTDFGIFGTSIAATWLDAQTGSRTKFFVDEDPQRAGKQHLGRPIYPVAQVPETSTVFVALPRPIAEQVICRARSARAKVQWLMA